MGIGKIASKTHLYLRKLSHAIAVSDKYNFFSLTKIYDPIVFTKCTNENTGYIIQT